MKTDLKTAGPNVRLPRRRAGRNSAKIREPRMPARPFDAVAYAAALEVLG